MASTQPSSERSWAYVLKKLAKVKNNIYKDQLQRANDKPVNWTCEVCKIPLRSLKTAVQHYNEREHLYKLQQSKNAFFAECKVCKSVFLTEWQHQKHFESAKHAENVLESGETSSPRSPTSVKKDDCKNDEERNVAVKMATDSEEKKQEIGMKKEFHINLTFDTDCVSLRNGKVLESAELFAVGNMLKSSQEESNVKTNDFVIELPRFLFANSASDEDDDINESKHSKKRRWDKSEFEVSEED